MKTNFKSVTNWFKQNWGMKCLSVLIAMIIWLIVVRYVNPEDTRRLNDIKIQVITEGSVPESEGLVLVTEYQESLSITYKASRDVIAVLNTDKVTAYVDLSNATKPGEHRFPVKIDTGGQNITVVDQSVKEAVLNFENSSTAQVKINVTVEGEVPEGYIKNDPVCSPAILSIEGPESKINKIASAEIKIVEKELAETTVYNCDYEFIDEDGNIVDKKNIITDYDKIDVTVSVFKTKVLPVSLSLINSSGGFDEKFATVSIVPKSITIAGNEEVLDTLNSYALGTIDVAEKLEDFEQSYVISLPNGIKNLTDDSTVDVSVAFGDVRTKTIKFTDIQIENLPEGQTAQVADKSISITFRGTAADIALINPSNVKLAIDFQNKTQPKGANSVPVYAVIPETYKIGVSGKYYVTVNID